MTENKTEQSRKNKEKPVYSDYNIFKGNVRLIREGDKPLIVDRDRAIEMAKELGMNLVQIGYNKTDYPHSICKFINLGKYKYEQKKKEKEEARKARIANAEAKEVVFSIRIDDNDKKTKIEHLKKFIIEDNMKVKITVKLLRREMNLLGMAKDLMHEILSEMEGIAEMDSNPSFNSGIMSCTLRPIKK